MQQNENVIHAKELIKKRRSELSGLKNFNNKLALIITKAIGTMWSAYIFSVLALVSLPAVLVLAHIVPSSTFPNWLISTGLIALVAWVAQTFLQLVLLPVIIVGQNLIQNQNDAKAEVDHHTLTYLANLQEEQMKELQGIKDILEELKKHK